MSIAFPITVSLAALIAAGSAHSMDASSACGSATSGLDAVVIAEDVASAQEDCDMRAPAKVSFRSDNLTSTREYSLKAAVLWPDILPHLHEVVASPFVVIDRESNANPAEAVDDLGFGLQLKGDVLAMPFSVAGSWVTDSDGFRSSVAKGDFRVRTPLDWPLRKALFRNDSGAGFWNGGVPPMSRMLIARFYGVAYVAADYLDVGDPGRKAALAATPSFGRLGYDLDAGLRIGRGSDQSSVWLTAAYQQRFDVSGHSLADVHLLDLGVELRPSDSSPYSFNLAYQRGRTLDSLTPVDTLSIGLGFKH